MFSQRFLRLIRQTFHSHDRYSDQSRSNNYLHIELKYFFSHFSKNKRKYQRVRLVRRVIRFSLLLHLRYNLRPKHLEQTILSLLRISSEQLCIYLQRTTSRKHVFLRVQFRGIWRNIWTILEFTTLLVQKHSIDQ